jgi:hypothetical protein
LPKYGLSSILNDTVRSNYFQITIMQTYYELQNLSCGLMIQQYTIGKKYGKYVCDSALQTCLFSEEVKDNLFFIKKHIPNQVKFDYIYSDFKNNELNETSKSVIETLCQPMVSIVAEKSFLVLPDAEDFSETAALFLLKTIQTPLAIAVVPNDWYLGVKRRLKNILKLLGNNASFLTS